MFLSGEICWVGYSCDWVAVDLHCLCGSSPIHTNPIRSVRETAIQTSVGYDNPIRSEVVTHLVVPCTQTTQGLSAIGGENETLAPCFSDVGCLASILLWLDPIMLSTPILKAELHNRR
jgi:hypothetical protein